MQPNQLPATQDVARSNKNKLVWGLICLIGPSALLILSILLYAIFNSMLGDISSGDMSHKIMNIFLYLVGVISVMTWLPGLIIGIILLATRRPNA